MATAEVSRTMDRGADRTVLPPTPATDPRRKYGSPGPNRPHANTNHSREILSASLASHATWTGVAGQSR